MKINREADALIGALRSELFENTIWLDNQRVINELADELLESLFAADIHLAEKRAALAAIYGGHGPRAVVSRAWSPTGRTVMAGPELWQLIGRTTDDGMLYARPNDPLFGPEPDRPSLVGQLDEHLQATRRVLAATPEQAEAARSRALNALRTEEECERKTDQCHGCNCVPATNRTRP